MQYNILYKKVSYCVQIARQRIYV